MPPKKKAAKKGGDTKDGEEEVTLDVWCSNYQKACKTLGIEVERSVVAALTPEEEGDLVQLCTDTPLGPAGVRAICASVLGKGTAMKGGAYKKLRSLRFWRSGAGDAGAAAVADLLKIGPREGVAVSHLEFLDSGVGPAGCLALGDSLMLGANKTLLTLRLDGNDVMGSAGLAQLVKGLRTNQTVANLHLTYCGIDGAGGRPLCQLLSFDGSALKLLNLQGNRLGSEGLAALCPALMHNKRLQTLNLCDNDLGAHADWEVNRGAFEALADALAAPETDAGLTSLDISLNRLHVELAECLLPALTEENKRIGTLKLDDTLPVELFDKICRADSGKKKGKKGKKGKKKKK